MKDAWPSKDVLELLPNDLLNIRHRLPQTGRGKAGRLLEFIAVIDATKRFTKHLAPDAQAAIERDEDEKVSALFAAEGLSLTTLRQAMRNPEIRKVVVAEAAKLDT
jgi:hypothetical protein